MNKLIPTAIVLFGCGAALLALPAAADSGFIDNPPPLAQDPDRPGAMIWTKPGLDRAAYTKVLMEPVTIFISPDSEYQGVDAGQLKTLADGFHDAVIKTLEPEVPVVTQPGAGVVHMRAAITDVRLAKKKRGLLSFTPVGLLVTAAESAAGANVSLKDAVLEIEMLDSVSGERLGVLVDKAPATDGKDLSWDAIDAAFTFYAGRFKSHFK